MTTLKKFLKSSLTIYRHFQYTFITQNFLYWIQYISFNMYRVSYYIDNCYSQIPHLLKKKKKKLWRGLNIPNHLFRWTLKQIGIAQSVLIVWFFIKKSRAWASKKELKIIGTQPNLRLRPVLQIAYSYRPNTALHLDYTCPFACDSAAIYLLAV